jgi:hypothetical protein
LITVSALIVGFISSPKADPLLMSPELKSFLTRPEEKEAVLGLMGEQWRALFEDCRSPKLKTMNVVIGTAPKFDPDGMPTTGQWRVVGNVEACGQTRVLNVLYMFTPDGTMKRIALLPGTTIADVRLQRDALVYAAAGMAKLNPKDCKDIKYIDTTFIGFDEAVPASGSNRRAWKEEWTLRTCGVTGIVTVHFTPNATGTNISVGLQETRPLAP